MPPSNVPRVLIVGAGPAGLSTAYELSRRGVTSTIVEADNLVGGLSRTESYKGYLFDIGGHRFFTKVSLIERMWREVLGADFIKRPRLSRIFYSSKFFKYPLEPWSTVTGLGAAETVRCGASFLKARLFPRRPEPDFETWVTNRFGKRLFEAFFKTYTEKVWGIPCREIQAEWAAQRIKGLSLSSLAREALTPKFAKTGKKGAIKTLIHEFDYPRLGPGMMWERTRDRVIERGSRIVMNSPVTRIEWAPGRVTAVHAGGRRYEADHFVSTMPIRDLLHALDPKPPAETLRAADNFRYRDFLTVVLIVRGSNLFPDNWIYVHDPGVKVGRVQNYKNWSPDMVPDRSTTCLGLEYFCFEGDGLWQMPNEDLLELGQKEMSHLGLMDRSAYLDGTVLRVRKAYPIYDDSYQRGLAAVRDFLKMTPNLQLAGRNGMHRYNNQDHSMLTGIFAARNILGSRYDLWQVNVDAEYQEEGLPLTDPELAGLENSQPDVPQRLRAATTDNRR